MKLKSLTTPLWYLGVSVLMCLVSFPRSRDPKFIPHDRDYIAAAFAGLMAVVAVVSAVWLAWRVFTTAGSDCDSGRR